MGVNAFDVIIFTIGGAIDLMRRLVLANGVSFWSLTVAILILAPIINSFVGVSAIGGVLDRRTSDIRQQANAERRENEMINRRRASHLSKPLS
ncbi:MAG: hypothetical protein LBN05_02890 [Oscillospiraceae bacterium]|jgi:hypothetical protein|nr:hypothetical protein [Oscillospiraceae bacterium]